MTAVAAPPIPVAPDAPATPTRSAPTAARRASVRRVGAFRRFAPLLWIGPAIALVGFVVIWPAVVMVQTSVQTIGPDGFVQGGAGFRNFAHLLAEPALAGVVARTIVWVAGVVVATMIASLALAQLLGQRFPGRRIARLALIAPWAASVMMTSIVFRWALNSNNGVINVFLHDIGVLKAFNTREADWLGNPATALPWMMVVATFVSIPFTTYAILAGLQAIPDEVNEAARMDGASGWRIYRSVTLPILRPALLVALLINVINVLNSFPIIWTMTRGGPGYETSTTTTFMYQLKQSDIGESAAMSIVNFALVIVVVLLFLRINRSSREAD